MSLRKDRKIVADPDTVLVFCAHSDDQVFGPGATLAKYAKEGRKVYTVIFSFGELTHPHMKESYTASVRVQESYKADKILGGSGVSFLGLKEGKFLEDPETTKEKIAAVIRDKKPSVIFTHSDEDMHPDHRAVYTAVLETVNDMHYKCDVYSFDIWLLFNYKKSKYAPKMYVDVTKTFYLKIRALKEFKSQFVAMVSLLWAVYFRAFFHGLFRKGLLVERFFKVR